MNPLRTGPALLAVVIAAALSVRAQEAPSGSAVSRALLVLTTGGELLSGEPVAAGEDGLTVRRRGDAAGGRTLPWSEVLGVHGRPPRTPAAAGSPRDAVVRLVGGDVLRGRIGAGDARGDTFGLGSPVLGARRIPLDRLQRIEFVARTQGIAPRALALPAGDEFAEAVFRPARRGLDRTLGEVLAFREDALLFRTGAEEEPRALPFAELTAIAIAGGFPPAAEPTAMLLTRTGDRLGVRLGAAPPAAGGDAVDAAAPLRVLLEDDTAVILDWNEVAALAPLGSSRSYLSDLEPEFVDERGWFAQDGDGALRPFRRDRSVAGEPLVAGERGFVKGLGVHARSVLGWSVPPDRAALVGAVALDDSVPRLGLRAQVDVAVEVDGERVFEVTGLRAGRVVPLGRLAVEPGQSVRLIADFGAGLDLGDRVDWLDVAFVP